MNDEIRTWDEDWDDDDLENDYAPTEDEVWNSLWFWAEIKTRGCHYTIITPYYNIVDGKVIPKRPPERKMYIVKPGDVKPMSDKERKRWRKAFETALKRSFGGFHEKEDYMEGWRKRMRRLSL